MRLFAYSLCLLLLLGYAARPCGAQPVTHITCLHGDGHRTGYDVVAPPTTYRLAGTGAFEEHIVFVTTTGITVDALRATCFEWAPDMGLDVDRDPPIRTADDLQCCDRDLAGACIRYRQHCPNGPAPTPNFASGFLHRIGVR